jgi:hypothetical protein
MDWLSRFLFENSSFIVVLLSVSFNLAVHFYFPTHRGGGTPRHAIVDNLIHHFIILFITVVGFWILLSSDVIQFGNMVALLFLYGVTLYIVLCELLQLRLAAFLTKKRGEKWIKELDYVYLTLGAVGTLGTVDRIALVSGGFAKIDLVAPAFVATAVVVRFIKTRAEIGAWNKLKPADQPALPSVASDAPDS